MIKAPGRGRPPKHGKAMPIAPVAVRLPDAMISQIDAVAANRLDQPDRSTVIRELLVLGLAAYSKKKKGRA